MKLKCQRAENRETASALQSAADLFMGNCSKNSSPTLRQACERDAPLESRKTLLSIALSKYERIGSYGEVVDYDWLATLY